MSKKKLFAKLNLISFSGSNHKNENILKKHLCTIYSREEINERFISLLSERGHTN